MTPENEIIFDFYKKLENFTMLSQEEFYSIDNKLGISNTQIEKTYKIFIQKIEKSLNVSYEIKNILNKENEFLKDVILGLKK